MWRSLCHACAHFNGDGAIEETDKDAYTVLFTMSPEPTPKIAAALKQYVKLYLHECGWTVVGVTFTTKRMRIKLRYRK